MASAFTVAMDPARGRADASRWCHISMVAYLGDDDASACSVAAPSACSVAAPASFSVASPCSVAAAPSSSITRGSWSSEGNLHVEAFMDAGPSRVGLKVCNVSMPWAPCRVAAGTPASGHCVRTCSSSIRTWPVDGKSSCRRSFETLTNVL